MRRRKTFEEHYIPVTESGCWIWIRAISTEGYGVMQLRGVKPYRIGYAHRYSYEQHNGPIPEGLHIDHLCRVRSCVNPYHLEAVTCKTNLLRGETIYAKNAYKTHCDHGHEFTEANTYRRPDRESENNRQCRECRRRRVVELAARRRMQRIGAIVVSLVLCFMVSTAHAADEVTLKYREFADMVSQCHACRKTIAAYKEKDQAQSSVIDSQKTYIESLEEGQRIQAELNTAYEAKLKDGEQLSWYERGAWLATGAVVALVAKRYVPMGRWWK